MQDKLKQILKYFSIFTTDPNRDWRRLFSGLIYLVLAISIWSFFFYVQINQDVQDSEGKRRPQNTRSVISEQEDDLEQIITKFEAKKLKNEEVVKGGYDSAVSKIADPSR